MENKDLSKLFFSLPYCGNHIDLGQIDVYGNVLAQYSADGHIYYFTHDESWDNIDFAGCDLSKQELKRLHAIIQEIKNG